VKKAVLILSFLAVASFIHAESQQTPLSTVEKSKQFLKKNYGWITTIGVGALIASGSELAYQYASLRLAMVKGTFVSSMKAYLTGMVLEHTQRDALTAIEKRCVEDTIETILSSRTPHNISYYGTSIMDIPEENRDFIASEWEAFTKKVQPYVIRCNEIYGFNYDYQPWLIGIGTLMAVLGAGYGIHRINKEYNLIGKIKAWWNKVPVEPTKEELKAEIAKLLEENALLMTQIKMLHAAAAIHPDLQNASVLAQNA